MWLWSLMNSFKGADGEFGKPDFTIPQADDGDVDGGDEQPAP
jgi:hypothetical protein